MWFNVLAILIMVLPLFARRRFPFAAPAVYWLIAVGLSFVDGRLIPFMPTIMVLGVAASFLLGNPARRLAGVGGAGHRSRRYGGHCLEQACPRHQ